MSDLTPALERSLEAAKTGGAFVAHFDLPSETELVAVHAQLARGVRGQVRLRVVRVLPMPTEVT
jgi:hypothetical protein